MATRASRGDSVAAPAPRVSLSEYMDDGRRLVIDEIRRLYGPDAHRDSHLYRLILDYPLRGGKALRPTLAIAMCRALGGYLEAVLPTAATLELYHNAFLIHDDVEDESLFRRGEPTLHADHGVPIAVNVGDAMLVLSLRPLLDNIEVVGLGQALRILDAIATMSQESVEGQAMELEWVRENRWDLDDTDYDAMVLKKTGWYSFITPLQIGATVGNADPEQILELVPFGRHLSVAFQITDDLLNLRPDLDAYGKEAGGDLWEGKRTVMLLHAVRSASDSDRARAIGILSRRRPTPDDATRAKLVASMSARGEISPAGARRLNGLGGPQKSDEDIRWLLDLIDRHGSMAYAAERARVHAEAAEDELASLSWLPDNRHVSVLWELVRFVHERLR